MDHLLDPSAFLSDIYKILKDDGVILLINHNVRFILTRLLGSKSPMFDIEHIYLFDKVTIRKILEKNHFEIITISNTGDGVLAAFRNAEDAVTFARDIVRNTGHAAHRINHIYEILLLGGCALARLLYLYCDKLTYNLPHHLLGYLDKLNAYDIR